MGTRSSKPRTRASRHMLPKKGSEIEQEEVDFENIQTKSNAQRKGATKSMFGTRMRSKKKNQFDAEVVDNTNDDVDAGLHDVCSDDHYLVSAASVIIADEDGQVGKSIASAVKLLCEEKQSCVVILNADQTVRGIVTEQDFVRKIIADEINLTADLSTIMTSQPACLTLDSENLSEHFERSLRLMATRNFRHVPFITRDTRTYAGCVDIVSAIASGKASGLAHALSFPAGKLVRVLRTIRQEKASLLVAGSLSLPLPLGSLGFSADQVPEDIDVVEAAKRMRDGGFSSLLVMSAQTHKLVGILTESDLVRKVLLQSLVSKDVQVAAVMTRNPISVKAEINPYDGLRMMIERGFRHLPVKDDEDIVVTTLDILTLVKISFIAHSQATKEDNIMNDVEMAVSRDLEHMKKNEPIMTENSEENTPNHYHQRNFSEEEAKEDSCNSENEVDEASINLQVAIETGNLWEQVLSSNLPVGIRAHLSEEVCSYSGEGIDKSSSHETKLEAANLEEKYCAVNVSLSSKDDCENSTSSTNEGRLEETVATEKVASFSIQASQMNQGGGSRTSFKQENLDMFQPASDESSLPSLQPMQQAMVITGREKEALDMVLSGKFKDAISCLDELVKDHTDSDAFTLGRLLTRRGHIKSCTGDLQGAYADLERGSEMAEFCKVAGLIAEATSGMCEILIETGRYEEASRRMKEQKMTDQQLLECQLQLQREMQKFKDLGRDLFTARDFTGAIVAYTNSLRALESLSSKPSDNRTLSILYSNRAACYQSIRDFKYATQDSEAAVAADATYSKGWTRLCTCLQDQARWKHCAECCQRAIDQLAKIDPSAVQKLLEIKARCEVEIAKAHTSDLDIIKSLGKALSAAKQVSSNESNSSVDTL